MRFGRYALRAVVTREAAARAAPDTAASRATYWVSSPAGQRQRHECGKMIRFFFGLYTLGIFVVFVLLLIFVPDIPLIDAVWLAALWPYAVYRHFIAHTGLP
jgi:hypothetical protein